MLEKLTPHCLKNVSTPILSTRGFPHALHHPRSISSNPDTWSIICPILEVSTPILFVRGLPQEAFFYFPLFCFFLFFRPGYAYVADVVVDVVVFVLSTVFLFTLLYSHPRSLAAWLYFLLSAFCLPLTVRLNLRTRRRERGGRLNSGFRGKTEK